MVRNYVLELDPRFTLDDLPFQETTQHEGKELRILYIVTGRQPQCFRCKEKGHIRPDCTATYCSVCQKLMLHQADTCPFANSYATKLGNASRRPQLPPGEVEVSQEDAPELFQPLASRAKDPPAPVQLRPNGVPPAAPRTSGTPPAETTSHGAPPAVAKRPALTATDFPGLGSGGPSIEGSAAKKK